MDRFKPNGMPREKHVISFDVVSDITASGRFVLRLPPAQHAALRKAAREARLSLNEHCVRRLAVPTGSSGYPAFSEVVRRASDAAGANLVGAAVFGSWARSEATRSSDIDVLVVVEPAFALTRAAYEPWDGAPLSVDGHRVEAHIARLPERGAGVTGLWAEVAIDGMVIFDRGLRLSFYLADVRRTILAGRIVRRSIHGQHYWHEVA